MKRKEVDIQSIKRLIGSFDESALKYVDVYAGEEICVFIPFSEGYEQFMTAYHTHPSYMFVTSFDGSLSFMMGKDEVVTEKGVVTAFSPGQGHRELHSEKVPRYMVIFIEASLFDRQLEAYHFSEQVRFRGDRIDVSEKFFKDVRNFMVEVENGLPGSSILQNSLGVCLCHSIIRSYADIKLNEKRLVERMEIDRTIQFMYDNYHSKISLDQLASEAKMSKSHFIRVFKQETGQSAIDYLKSIRIDKVQRLLTEKELTVTEIAYKCGFSSAAYMSTTFQAVIGMSPSEYRDKFSID